MANTNFILSPYPYTDDKILRKNPNKALTVQNRTHVYMNFFHHKDLGDHILQLCPKVVKHPV